VRSAITSDDLRNIRDQRRTQFERAADDHPFRNALARGLNLSASNWDEEDFTDCDLSEANLSACTFGGADFRDADLWGADLRGSDLSSAQNLLPHQLAAADLSQAKLPKEIESFDVLEAAKGLAENSSRVFLVMLGAIAYTFLTIANTKDVQLLTDSGSSQLPVINVQIPIVSFYIVTPILLLGVYIYFHIYLQRLWEAIAKLPAIFPDGMTVDEKTPAWLLTDLPRKYFSRLAQRHLPLATLQSVLSITLAYWLVPLTLAAIWLKFLRVQDWPSTMFHIAMLCFAVCCGALFTRLLHVTLEGKADRIAKGESPSRASREQTRSRGVCATEPLWKRIVSEINLKIAETASRLLQRLREQPSLSYWFGTWWGIPVGFLTFLFAFGWSFVVLEWDRDVLFTASGFNSYPRESSHLSHWQKLGRWLEREFPRLGIEKSFRVPDENISVKPPSWTGLDRSADAELGATRGVNLSKKSVRKILANRVFLAEARLIDIDASCALFPNADFRSATFTRLNAPASVFRFCRFADSVSPEDMDKGEDSRRKAHGAVFESCRFDGADLSNAYLYSVRVSYSDFRQANLSYAKLAGAWFLACNFSSTNLGRADCTGTYFYDANLLRLRSDSVREVNFERANCSGAFFANCVLPFAKFTSATLDHARFVSCDLLSADFTGASLVESEFSDTDVTEEQLRKAKTLFHAKIGGDLAKKLEKEINTPPPPKTTPAGEK
jgi:uncharacterized protein YjbI with pentapeptide repeats